MNKQEYESLKSGDKLKIVSLDYTAVGDANFEIGEVVEFAGYHENILSNNDLLVKKGNGYSWYMSSKDLEIVGGDIEYEVGDEVIFIAYEDDRQWETGYGGVIGEKYTVAHIDHDDSIYIKNELARGFYVKASQIKIYQCGESCVDKLNKDSHTHDVDDSIKTPIKSDGGSSSYYFTKLPQHMIDKITETGGIEIKDITRYVYDNDSDCKDITKALKRIQEWKKGGGKQGIDALYDANKIIFFAEELRESIKNDFGDKLN